MANNDDEGFDLIQPSLIQQLRTILDQYPDDGQILKELIQNAEDARASQVKFLHDKHSYGTGQLYDEDLAKFQGPALYAYNNALFTKADWKGIRLVCDSIKVEDPMKVGRFGLGFKSVFHMTDLPSLLSDRQIGFIDPHGVHFSDKRYRRTGKHWRLHDDRASMDEIPDQFLPYKGIFSCTDEAFSQGFYNGTLFRFPFRSEPSELSETLYSAEKIDTLFESFKADSPLILLFLQHLESIELYVREESESSPRKIFQVKIAEKSLQTVRAKRKEFQEKIKPGEVIPTPITVTYPITIETVNFDSPLTDNTNQHSFLVTNYFCGGPVSSTFKRLMTDKDLSYLPTVGVAMALPTGPKLETPTMKGHVFCFLPLPVQKTSLTGLPVHVNGFFALSQNRRYIKSPNADQEDHDKAGRHLTDKSLLWNKCLLEEAIPRAYATMIFKAIEESSFCIPRTAIYKAWPDIKRIDQKWERIIEPFFHILFQKEIVYTKANHGKWMTIEKALFDLLPESEPKELLQKVLLAVNLPVVSVPSHIIDAIATYSTIMEITARGTRIVLKRAPVSYKNLDRRDKLSLLRFCLRDGQFADLCDLELLPLANGAFTIFSNRADQIYICSPQHPRELLPGLKHRLLDETVGEDIIRNLKNAAKQECTQLRLLSKDDVAVLLRQALPSDWSKGKTVSWYSNDRNHNHPPRDWINRLWVYLQDHFSTTEELQRLGNLPLIPINMSQSPVTMTRLCYPSSVVVKRLNDDCVNDTLTNVLTKLGVIVLNDYPSYIRHHPAVLGTFVNPPSAHGVLNAMVTSASRMPTGSFSEIVRREVSTKGKRVLRSFLANVRTACVEMEQYSLLCSLPVFETLSETFVSAKHGLCAAPVEPFPIPPLRDLIDVSQDDSKTLAGLLKVRILKPTELLCEMILPDIQQGKYTDKQIDKLMPYVLKRSTQVIRTNDYFKRSIQALSFVPKQRERVRASDVFDPRNHTLQEIFATEDVFPVGEQYNDPTVLVMLEQIGMKNESRIAATDLFQSAKQVSVITHLPTARRKANAIFQHLRTHPQKLKDTIDWKQLGSFLMHIPWVSRLRQKTSNFPPSLPWFEKDDEEERHFFKPTELKSRQLVNLIGTVEPVVDVEQSDEVSQYFGWQKKPDVLNVIWQLRNVITCYSKEEKPYYMVMLNEIYSFLSCANYESVSQAFQLADIFDWVWNGDGFSSPNHVLSSKPQIDLTPYILHLPSETMKHSHLFNRFGMKDESDLDLLLQVLSMIKEKYDSQNSRFDTAEVRHDLQLSVDILNEVASEELLPEVQAKILLPTHVEDNTCVRLEPAEHCMYCEQKEWLKTEGEDEDMEYFYVHSNVPNITAERLGVPSLTNRMLDPDELFIGEEFGQEEKLTTRLNRLLEHYTDGFAVPKELIQNADDAGATEVRFLYDERTNEEAMTCLINEGMRGCQGPALWVYNDANFRDEDFVNITKLNEATKVHDTDKIGRFGLGFNAVYNLTDVPMFVSRNYFAIFDPHTSYLGKAIKNKRKPGMKIDLNKDVKRLRKFSNQFKPFNGIFGCDLHLGKEDNSFDGTLFRFPLRTREQAFGSEIKHLWYNQQQMCDLLQMLVHGANSLLLFTQNILRVRIYHLPKLVSRDPQPALMFQVTKSPSPSGILRELLFSFTPPTTAFKLSPEEMGFLQQCNFLQASSKVKTLARGKNVDPRNFPKSSMIVDVNCSLTKSGSEFFHADLNQQKATWLVVSSMGNGQALDFAKGDPSLLPSAGAAVQLVRAETNSFLPSPVVKNVDGLNLNGSVFCYLPLPIHSGLPVHINGAFAVASNRRHLQEKVEDDKSCYGVNWNYVLLQDSVTSAFLNLLEDVKGVAPKDSSYDFYSLWPRAAVVQRNCWPLTVSFYSQLTRDDWSLFSDGEKWVGIKQVVFLDPQFRMKPHIGDAARNVLQMCCKGNEVVIDLPCDILHSFELCGLKEAISARKYSKSKFFHEVFFPNITIVPTKLRDVLTLHALDDNSGDFHDLIKLHACIPASPSGNTLKYPSHLVHPFAEAASLFCPEDGRFPFGTKESYLNLQRLAKLVQLGMASNDLPWSEITERAENIQSLNEVDSKKALKRVKALLSFMEKKVNYQEKLSPEIYSRILKANFLPILKKPQDFPLPWRGDELVRNSQLLVAPNEAFLEERKYLVCCTEPLVGVFIPRHVRWLLNLDSKQLALDNVMQQLTTAISAKVDSLNASEYNELCRVCKEAYSFLQQTVAVCGDGIMECLLGKRFILVGRRFLSANEVAFTLTADCSPYLYKLPQQLGVTFTPLMVAAGVKKKFDEQDFISSLQQTKNRFDKTTLDEQSLQVATHLVNLLGETVDPTKAHKKWGAIYLPDSKGILRPICDLCVRDCPWLPDEIGVNFVNDKIPWPTCDRLGVKTRREEALRPHVVGIPFGQREKLTNRLKRILTGYPCEKEILKELLQNADDAQATEICFIKDPRHHPDERVFEDIWKPLQGPALCVYNNKPFTNADIEGIRNLGEGSKGEDPNKTGQYGVGFNAVYHITDVPSFMTKGKDIGDVLCAFDPHCRYVPGATAHEPGIMLKDITALRNRFPDVFPCYLVDHFPIDNGTMFRFPLRTRQMSLVSQISSNPVTLGMLDTMLEELKKELFEVLLFVNNVKKIKLCEVHETSGKLVNVYSVEATMSKEDEAKRQALAVYVKQIGEMIKGGKDLIPSDIPVQKVSYVLNISDSLGNQEKWLIVQQIGFDKAVKKSIIAAFNKHELGMLPRGGVACLLEKNSTAPAERRKKAYCFLPLPFETDLPVHINGHFALDYETRRNLWRYEAGGYRSDWNNVLLGDVVASCYLTLLVEVRAFLNLPIDKVGMPCILTCSESEILQKINAYEGFFPLTPSTDPYWKTLVDSLYHEISNKEFRVLPVVRNKSTNVVEVTWLPPNGSGKHQAFFNDLVEASPFVKTESRKRLEEVLLESGFNLVAFSMALYQSFRRSNVSANSISPSSVIDFYKSFTSQEPLCKIGPIPCSVNETPFRDAFGVILVLLYCKGVENFIDHLSGLPLLLTQDSRLQLFSSRHPKFLSRFRDILPGSPQVFLHELVDRKVFIDTAVIKSSILKPLDAEGFAENLAQTLQLEQHGKGEFIEWSLNHKAPPNQQWISRVWMFLSELTEDVRDDPRTPEECKSQQIKAALGSLANWSVLPATESKRVETKSSLLSFLSLSTPKLTAQFLVPLCQATCVLDFKSSDSTNLNLVKLLQKLGVPELNYAALYSSSNAIGLARLMVSSLRVPASLLAALDHKIETDPQSPERLDPSDCRVILEYFSKSVSCLRDTDRGRLRRLPFYLATHGGKIPLDHDRRVCVLPIGIPRNEIDTLERQLSVVFIESCTSLSNLFKFLALECVSAAEVYCTYILPNLSIFSQKARQVYLEYMRKYILSDLSASDDDKQRLRDCLQNTPIIPSPNGTLKTASSFYDPCVDVFRIMLSECNFPRKPLNSPEWLTILRTIGLVHKVSHEHFKRFACVVADEAATKRTENTFQKSQVLVKHLIHRHNVVAEELLPAICDIPFVASERVRKPLRELCQPFQEMRDGQIPFCAFKGAVPSNYAEIVWTKANLLPRWADLMNCRYELDYPDGMNIEQYCNAFTTQLEIVRKPSVDIVARHCQTVCYLHENKNDSGISSLQQRATKKAVMERIYQFLQTNLIKDGETKSILANTPCILVDQEKKFIRPSQAVLELYEHLEIKPFLYSVPQEFGKFHSLFHALGSSKSVTIIHYAMVLEMLHERSQNAKLHPNEVAICVKAVKGFFRRLEESVDEVTNLSQLFLPGMSPRSSLDETVGGTPVTLQESSKLVFNDKSSALLNRLQNFQRLLLDLRSMKVTCTSATSNYKELVMNLPTALRPIMLSSVVNERLFSQNTTTLSIGAVNSLKHRLSSPQFAAAIVRLIRDQNLERKDFNEDAIANIKRGLQSIDIRVIESLRSILFCDGKPIPESDAEVPYFLENSVVSGEEKWTVYLNAVTGIDESSSIISSVSNLIVELYGDLLGKRAVLIPQMLACHPSSIWALLDASDVRQDDSFCATEVDIFPTLGTFIPLIDHHLLNEAFEEFEAGEYVGYELEDPSLNLEEGVATYIYARIVQEVTDGGRPLLTKRYRIDIGDDHEIEVDVTDLYKFHRLPVTPSSAIVVYEYQGRRPPERPRSKNKQEVFDEISDLLEAAWKLPEDKRRKIIKRLYLQWHPDKNMADEEFCTEVSKHIQSEVFRLERGEPRGSQESSNVGANRTHHGSYDDFFTSWEARAREHHTQREGYRTRQQFPGSSTRASNPQPGEARRWFRQAMADIAATENDIVYCKPSYEWACFKCHQAAEKALKAAQYAIDAERTNVHNLVQICYGLDDSELTQLASRLECLVGNSTRMRYPDRVSFPQIPNDVYSSQMAQDALQLAKWIAERVQNRLT